MNKFRKGQIVIFSYAYILPSCTTLSVIERTRQPAIAVSTNTIFMITSKLASFHAKSTSVCSEEKIQVIVWPHNQCFTKLATRRFCARELHVPRIVLFHFVSIQLYIIRYKSSCYRFLSFYMAHAFHVNDTNFKSLTAPVPQGSWRQAQHNTLG